MARHRVHSVAHYGRLPPRAIDRGRPVRHKASALTETKAI
jgi:hypothetical protein